MGTLWFGIQIGAGIIFVGYVILILTTLPGEIRRRKAQIEFTNKVNQIIAEVREISAEQEAKLAVPNEFAEWHAARAEERERNRAEKNRQMSITAAWYN